MAINNKLSGMTLGGEASRLGPAAQPRQEATTDPVKKVENGVGIRLDVVLCVPASFLKDIEANTVTLKTRLEVLARSFNGELEQLGIS